jgi:hypothetical protein
MKPLIYILALFCGAALGIFVFREFFKPVAEPQKLTLEQVLYIKELHLVKHTYNDLFFLHKKNDKRKAIRAMVQVPVTVTAYLNLKEVQIIRANDSIRQVILPHAYLGEPAYHTDKMVVRETRALQVYAGKDLYAQVPNYMQALIHERIEVVRALAISNQILIQAETEGKHYIENILATLGHTNVTVSFGDPLKDAEVIEYEEASDRAATPATYKQAYLAYGFLPL